jgi:hypothetical protein
MPALILRFGLIACALALLLSCSTPPRTTRMTVDDIEAMGAAMAQSLASSDALRGRDAESPRWTVSIDKVLNLSSDVMTDAEQWAIMARLRSTLPVSRMAEQHNLHFVLPPEKLALLREHPDAPELAEGLAGRREVTHTLAATFRSVTRATGDRRSELYYCEFELFDLRAGRPVWTDRFEYKRAAHGKIWD